MKRFFAIYFFLATRLFVVELSVLKMPFEFTKKVE